MTSGPRDERLRRLVHDLRTPVTVIAGFADLLRRGEGRVSAEQRAEYVERIADAAAEMRVLLDASDGPPDGAP